MTKLMSNHCCMTFLLLSLLFSAICSAPIDHQQQEINSNNDQPNNPAQFLSSSLHELEWLLNQLINLLTEMVDNIELDSSLLHNRNFKNILIQIIKRIDIILQHFETLDQSMMTSNIQYELDRIECIRIRLANYLSHSRRFDDRKCYRLSSMATSTTHKPDHHPHPSMTNDEMMPIMKQIVAVLTQISSQLYHIEHKLGGGHHGGQHGGQDPPSTTTAPSSTIANQRPILSEIDWDNLFNQAAQSSSSSSTAMPVTIFDFNQIFNDSQSTANWSELISQAMVGMSSTTMSPMITTQSPPTTNWEDMMNTLIREFTRQQMAILQQPSNTQSRTR